VELGSEDRRACPNDSVRDSKWESLHYALYGVVLIVSNVRVFGSQLNPFRFAADVVATAMPGKLAEVKLSLGQGSLPWRFRGPLEPHH